MKCGFPRAEVPTLGVELPPCSITLHNNKEKALQQQILLREGVTLIALVEIMKKMTSLKCSMSFKGLTLGGYDKKKGFSFRRSSGKREDSMDDWDDIFDAKSPDVQPPRNDRRTLKLSKSDEQGYGFWLQTYDFGKANSVKKKRTFVRYVEDEGPAYLAGLRAGDVIIEVNGQNVEDIEHMKIVGLISETAKQLMLVVKFMDMVRRVELAIRLKNRQAKLKVKLEELEKLKEEEKKILNTADDCECSKEETVEPSRLSTLSTLSAYSSTYSSSLEVDLDRLSLNSSSESGIGSLSSISDEITVRTSKFEKRSSRVLDSIKELNCACSSIPNPSGLIAGRSGFNTQHSNIDKNPYSSDNSTPGKRTVKRTESMPVQKRNSLQIADLTLEPFEYPMRRERDTRRDDEKMLSNDDMLFDKRHSDGDVYRHHTNRHGTNDMTYGKRISVDDMLYDKTLCDSDMLYKRLSATGSSVASDSSSSGGDSVTLRGDRYTTNPQLPSIS